MKQDNDNDDRFLLLKLLFPTTTAILSAWAEKRRAKRREFWRKEWEWAEKWTKWENEGGPFRTFVGCIGILVLWTLVFVMLIVFIAMCSLANF